MSTNFRNNVLRTIRPYTKFIPQLTQPVLRVLMQVSKHYIESKKCTPEVLDLALNKLTHYGHEIPENFCELFAAVLQIMQLFLRTPKGMIKDQELKECLKDLRFPDECVEDLSKELPNCAFLSKSYVETKLIRSTPKHLKWRINLSLIEGLISTPTTTLSSPMGPSTSLAAAVEHAASPTIILHFQLPNGRYRTLELPVAMFHRIRYNLAMLLSEMQALESRAVMKKF